MGGPGETQIEADRRQLNDRIKNIKAKIKVFEKKFKEKDVFSADGVFITNSSAIILEANKLNNKKKFKIYDLRNLYSPLKMKTANIKYYSIGR